MSIYRYNSTVLSGITALPSCVAEQHLKLAGALQLKVLLWFAANGGSFDADACAKAVGYTPSDCVDAMQYWVLAGVLHTDDSAPVPVQESVVTEKLTPPTPAPTPRPRAVKPQMKEVMAAKKQAPDFAYLLDTVSARLGKALTYGDMETLLYLYDTAHLPAEVILMVVEYAVQADHFSMRYIEKVALDWADKGIVTIAAAEQYLCYLERCQQALLKVQTVCGITTPLSATTSQLTLAEKWVFVWHMPDELLSLAYALCLEKQGKFNGRYIDRILENWQAQGIKTAAEAADVSTTAKKQVRKTDADEHSEYEQLVENYVPVYKKKTRKGDGQ